MNDRIITGKRSSEFGIEANLRQDSVVTKKMLRLVLNKGDFWMSEKHMDLLENGIDFIRSGIEAFYMQIDPKPRDHKYAIVGINILDAKRQSG